MSFSQKVYVKEPMSRLLSQQHGLVGQLEAHAVYCPDQLVFFLEGLPLIRRRCSALARQSHVPAQRSHRHLLPLPEMGPYLAVLRSSYVISDYQKCVLRPQSPPTLPECLRLLFQLHVAGHSQYAIGDGYQSQPGPN